MQPKRSTTISAEQALKNLYGELKLIDGQTRADGSQRTVKSIKSLTGAITRSGNALDNDLLYIVEFDEGEGSAVLAADTRLDPVIAVLDSSVLTAEDFASTNEDDINVYMASLIEDYAVCSSEINSLPLIPVPDEYDTTYTFVGPFLNTKWHQRSPFNDLCYDENGNKAVAGCSTIAAAQFIYYMKPNDEIIINGTEINTSNFSSLRYGYTPSYNAKDKVSIFVLETGYAIDADFGVSATSASLNDVANLLTDVMGYTHILGQYLPRIAENKLDVETPVIMQGSDIQNDGCHAWILDGYYQGEVTTKKFTMDGGAETIYVGSVGKVHCNFGWGGLCDGYYVDNMFDTATRNYDIDSSVGDYTGNGGYNFSSRFWMINTD